MSSAMNKLCCIFCIKEYFNVGNTTNYEETRKYFNLFFTVVLKRHFNSDFDINPLLLESDINKVNPCCNDCFTLVKLICKLYHDLKLVELNLEWRLSTLLEIMQLSGRVLSRKTSLDLNVNGDSIVKFRQRFIKNFASRRFQSVPKIRLERITKWNEESTVHSTKNKFVGDTTDVSNETIINSKIKKTQSVDFTEEPTISHQDRLCLKTDPEERDNSLNSDENNELEETYMETEERDSESEASSDTKEERFLRRMFRCNICHKTFSTSDSFETHKKLENHIDQQTEKATPEIEAFVEAETITKNDDDDAFVPKSEMEDSNVPSESETTQNYVKSIKTISKRKSRRNYKSTSETKEIKSTRKRNKPLQCPKCPTIFLRKDLLFLHKLSHRHDSYKKGKLVRSGRKYYFRCDLCPFRRFMGLKMLQRHQNKFHSQNSNIDHDEPEKQPECEIQPSAQLKQNDSNKLIFECKEEPLACKVKGCNETFTLPEELENHSKFHGKFTCIKCSKIFNFAPDLAKHEAEKHILPLLEEKNANRKSLKGIQCLRCDFKVKDIKTWKANFIKHMLEVHLKLSWATYICEICRKPDFTELQGIRERNRIRMKHFISFHDVSKMNPEDIQRCDYEGCAAYFNTLRRLTAHKKEQHREKIVCEECGKEFSSRQSRSVHVKGVHKITFSISCVVEGCDEKFHDQVDMTYHVQFMHKGGTVNQNLFKCSMCTRKFPTIRAKQQHLIVDHKKKRRPLRSYVCEHCGKEFKEKCNLARHHLSHSGPDSWQFCCKICGRKCMTEQKLREHERTHSKEKAFQCSVCGDKYAHRHNLRNHYSKKHPHVAEEIPRRSNSHKTNVKGKTQ